MANLRLSPSGEYIEGTNVNDTLLWDGNEWQAGQATVLSPVANGAALTTLNSSLYPDGQLVWVQTYREFFRLHKNDPNPLLANVTLAASGGGAQDKWERTTIASSSARAAWGAQAAWYINPATGSDEADGAVATPIKNPDELMRRLKGAVVNQVTMVHVLGDIGVVRGEVTIGPAGVLVFDGQDGATTLFSNRVSSWTARNPGAQEYGLLKLAGLADWTPYVNKRLRITAVVAGNNVQSLSWVAKVNPKAVGNDTARVSFWTKLDMTSTSFPPPSATEKQPALADTIAIENLVNVAGVNLTVNLQATQSTDSQRGVFFANCTINGAGDFSTVAIQPTLGTMYQGFYGCDIHAFLIGGSPYAASCRLTSPLGLTTGSFSMGSLGLYDMCLIASDHVVPNFSTWRACLWQGSMLDANFGCSQLLQDNAFFDGTDAISVQQGGSIDNHGAGPFGDGNSGVGINATAGNLFRYTIKPTVTGAGGDTKIAGVVKAYAAIPFFDTVTAAGVVG